MKFAADYKSGTAFVRDFGEDRLDSLEMAAQISHAESCPFCGGEAVLSLTHFPMLGCAIECNSCHCKTLYFHENSRVGGKLLTSVYACLAEALARWNKRQ